MVVSVSVMAVVTIAVIIVVGTLSLRKCFGNKVLDKANDDVIISKENDKDRTEIVDDIEEHQEEIKDTTAAVDTVIESNRENLLEKRKALLERREKLDEK